MSSNHPWSSFVSVFKLSGMDDLRGAWVESGVIYHMEVKKKWSEFGAVGRVVDNLVSQVR